MTARVAHTTVDCRDAFALSQFFMAWILAFLYVAAAAGWDRQAAAVLAKFNRK